MREEENLTLQKDFLATQKWVDTKMNQQDMFHCRMVAKYHQMMVKCKTYEEQLETINTENSRFKIVAQSIAHKIEELTGCNVENSSFSSENCDCFNDENMSLEVSGAGRIVQARSREYFFGREGSFKVKELKND